MVTFCMFYKEVLLNISLKYLIKDMKIFIITSVNEKPVNQHLTPCLISAESVSLYIFNEINRL